MEASDKYWWNSDRPEVSWYVGVLLFREEYCPRQEKIFWQFFALHQKVEDAEDDRGRYRSI